MKQRIPLIAVVVLLIATVLWGLEPWTVDSDQPTKDEELRPIEEP